MIRIIDCGISNIGSVLTAFRHLGVEAAATTDAKETAIAEGIILPGVGSFRDGMDSLRRMGMVIAMKEAADRGTPILGICLGMQLLADASEEFGEHEGLGLIPGRVVRLQPSRSCERVPNIGWCDLTARENSPLFLQIPTGTAYYFVHSYHMACREMASIAATIAYGDHPITAAVARGNIHGVQFHPEKSQDAGLEVLAAFAEIVQSRHA